MKLQGIVQIKLEEQRKAERVIEKARGTRGGYRQHRSNRQHKLQKGRHGISWYTGKSKKKTKGNILVLA